MKKLITYIGPKEYTQTCYVWGNNQMTTQFFPVAVAQWCQPDKICVLLTEEAKKSSNWQACEPQLRKYCEVKTVEIPKGTNEEQLWEIFEKLTGLVEAQDEIILDITHGFRSLPVVGLIALAYLQQVKGAKIQHLLYGAFEAKQDDCTPVFDLTPFLRLFDWLVAVNLFLETGRGNRLAQLLEEVQDAVWRERSVSQPEEAPRKLKQMAEALREVSDALLLSRVPLIGTAFTAFDKTLHSAKADIEQWVLPLVPLLEQISQAYAPYKQGTHDQQIQLIEWYLKHGHIVQAVTLMREWIVSEYLVRNRRNPREVSNRSEAEKELNYASKNHDFSDKLVAIWKQTIDLRNDIAHCGFGRAQDQVLSPDSIQRQAQEILAKIKEASQG